MTEQGFKDFTAAVGGMYVIAMQLASWLERPGMSVEVLRESMAARVLREHWRDFENCWLATRCSGIVTTAEAFALMQATTEVDAENRQSAVLLQLDADERAAVVAAGDIVNKMPGHSPYREAMRRVLDRLDQAAKQREGR